MVQVTQQLLGDYRDRSIGEICPHGFDSRGANHCAHFVSHVLQLGFGMTCARLRGQRGASAAANVRVKEIFERCPQTREVLECPTVGSGLLFVSARRNFSGTPTRIRNVPRKHMGIALNGRIWHYSNSRRKVVVQTFSEFLFHFPRQRNTLWWGGFPTDSAPTGLGTSTR